LQSRDRACDTVDRGENFPGVLRVQREHFRLYWDRPGCFFVKKPVACRIIVRQKDRLSPARPPFSQR
jgi:hypothetical protein